MNIIYSTIDLYNFVKSYLKNKKYLYYILTNIFNKINMNNNIYFSI